jgi:signal transduction histidine kinase
LMECHEPRGKMRLLPVGVMEPVKTLYEDRDGSLWCGYEDGGLLRVGTNGALSAYRQADGLPGPGVVAICRDNDGILWLGGREGLARWEEGRLQTTDHRPQTADPGSRISGHGYRISRFGREQGLPEGAVVQIVSDEQGGLWLGTASGIVRLDRRELARTAAGEDVPLTIRLMGRDDGLPSEECTGSLLLKGWQPFRTNLWFGTATGLVQLNPARIPPPGKAPKVVFESLRVDGREQVSGNALGALARGAFPASVRLPPGSRRIVIGFSALGCAIPERTRFRYKLGEGGWSPLSSERSVAFESLSPGRYSLRVTALGGDGAWNLEGAVLELNIAPRFWQTGWFAAGVMALVAVFAALGMRWWLRRRYRRRMAELERQKELQEERSRISRDLHDEIGSKLSRLSFLGALLQHATGGGDDEPVRTRATEMAATAAETLSAFDDVVWAASPRHDSLHSLVDHICRHAEEYFSGSPVACRFEVTEPLPDWPVEPKARNAIFLAVKEALNNILKHARASAVEIAITVMEKRLRISVNDNGIGFDSGDATRRAAGDVHGSGLVGMRDRLAAIGGACKIESAPGRGTRIVMEWEAR